MRYSVIYAEKLTEFVTLVNGAIAEGWRPLGNPFYGANGDFHQALVQGDFHEAENQERAGNDDRRDHDRLERPADGQDGGRPDGGDIRSWD